MSYRIEYLRETTEAETVCHTLLSHGADLDEVEEEAFARSEVPRVLCGATGFQIRQLDTLDEVIAIVEFDA